MELHMSYDDNDAQSYVSALGPQLGQGGRVVRPAQRVVYPFGPDPLAAAAGKVPLLKPGMVALHLSLDEAEALAEKLIDLVREARNWVGRTARCPLGGSFSVLPPAEPDWPVSEHPALQ